MFERLRILIAGSKPIPMPVPQTRVVGGGSDDNPYPRLGFGPEGERRKNIVRWRDIYRQGGLYADLIDAYPLYCLTNGWELACEDGAETLKEKVQAWLDEPWNDLDSIMWQGILDAVICGTAFQEILPDQGTYGIWGLIPRDAATFRIKYDATGRIIGYAQIIEDIPGNPREISIDVDRMLTLTLFPIPGNPYGASIVQRAIDDIMRDCDIIESITTALHRHGTPKHVWNVGSAENPASPGDLDKVRDEIEKIDKMTDFVVTHDTIPRVSMH